MMHPMVSGSYRHWLLFISRLLVIATFALRVLVPVGYMPSAVSGGWILQLCPDGLSPQVMARLLGGGHAHHHHHHADDSGSAQPQRCDLGSALSAELGQTEIPALPQGEAGELTRLAGESSRAVSPIIHAYRPRAPPIASRGPLLTA
jgi:hypothetical protein